MRSVSWLCPFGIVLVLLVGCSNEENSQTIPEPRETDFGGGTVGSGVDPSTSGSSCYPSFEELELNVATWNLEWFPQNGATTWTKVKDIVEDLQADVIAVQEINNPSQYRLLEQGLVGYEAAYSDVAYDQELGFIYKRDAFKSFGNLVQLFDGDSYAFPRQAVRADVVYADGTELTLINIHLKCCNDGTDKDRRLKASQKLKSYIDVNLVGKAVIILGDWNDEISTGNSPFQNFKDDSNNYRFVDMNIAMGSSSDYSYPSWPSHLDHILITNELFTKAGDGQTLKLESCVSSYSSDVSDHRPVLASFR